MMEDRLKKLSKMILFNDMNSSTDEARYSDNRRLYNISEKVKDDKTRKKIIVMGINPSESNDKKDSDRDKNYLEYVPNASENLNKELRKKNLINIGYFKPNYELFEKVQMTWILFEDSIESIKSISKKIDTSFEFDTDNKKEDLLIFADLIYYHNKQQKNIEKILNETYSKGEREKLRKNIQNMIMKHIEMFDPKLIVVTNAYASNLIYESFAAKENEKYDVKEKIEDDVIKVKNVPIILSGMVSGQRALDKYSYYRLKKRISEVYQNECN